MERIETVQERVESRIASLQFDEIAALDELEHEVKALRRVAGYLRSATMEEDVHSNYGVEAVAQSIVSIQSKVRSIRQEIEELTNILS